MSNIFIYFLFIGISFYTHAQTNFDNKPLYVSRILDVWDGDTFRANLGNCGRDLFCNNIRIRLNKIDTPEIRSKSKSERFAATIARDKLNEILSTSYLIELKDCQRGKYFRLVCDVLADGLSVSDILVTEGVAKLYGEL